MGCITSTNKLNELRQENVFRVRVAHLQPSGPEAPIIRSGFLELTPRELIFMTPGCEPIVWALQHLRRYGLNGDLFSFEAGRRCMSGPGIYTFRIHNAEQLYPMFQRFINAVNTDAFAQVERERERVNSANSGSVLMGRSDLQPHSNNYLEPAPLLARNVLQSSQQHQSNDMLVSATTDSPDSLPNLQLIASDPGDGALQSPITPGAYINTTTNVYFDQPLQRLLQEQNSTNNYSSPDATSSTTNSAFSTMHRQQQQQQQHLVDMPPQELAPMLNDTLRLYANVDRLLCDERCYENINRLDLPLLPRDSSQHSVTSAAQQQQQQQQPQQQQPQPVTPTSLTGVNYIVLDLDQPRSPVQSSPKILVTNGFGSGQSITNTVPVTPDGTIAAGAAATGTSTLKRSPKAKGGAVATVATTTAGATSSTDMTIVTQGYSTIDFIRTNALNKSSTASPHELGELPAMCQNLPDHLHEDGELRITRHSKCMRKAYSISE